MIRHRRLKTLITFALVIGVIYYFLSDSRIPEEQKRLEPVLVEKQIPQVKRVEERLTINPAERSKYEYLSNRIKEYCNTPYDKVTNAEGKFDASKYRIVSAHIIMKASHHAPQLSVPNFSSKLSCSLDKAAFAPFAYPPADKFADFYKPIRESLMEGIEAVNGRVVTDQESCKRGALTTLGAVQNIVYGRRAANIYEGEWRVLGLSPSSETMKQEENKNKEKTADRSPQRAARLTVRSIGQRAMLDAVNAYLFGFLDRMNISQSHMERLNQEVVNAYKKFLDGQPVPNIPPGEAEPLFSVYFSSKSTLCLDESPYHCECFANNKLRAQRDSAMRTITVSGARSKAVCTMLQTPLQIALNGTPYANLSVESYYGAVDIAPATTDQAANRECVVPHFVDTFMPLLCQTNEFACRPGVEIRTQRDRIDNCVQPVDIEKLFDATDYIRYHLKLSKQQLVFGAMYVYPFINSVVKSIEARDDGVHMHFIEDELFRSLALTLFENTGRQWGFAARIHIEVLESLTDRSVHLRFLLNGEDMTRHTIGCTGSPCNEEQFSHTVTELPSHAMRMFDPQLSDPERSSYHAVCEQMAIALTAKSA